MVIITGIMMHRDCCHDCPLSFKVWYRLFHRPVLGSTCTDITHCDTCPNPEPVCDHCEEGYIENSDGSKCLGECSKCSQIRYGSLTTPPVCFDQLGVGGGWWGGGGVLPLVGRGVPTKPKIWTHTDTEIIKKTSPLGCQTLKHAHTRPIVIPNTFP